MARTLNQVVFEPLGRERSWTLPVYRETGGYQAWEKILREKPPRERVITLLRDYTTRFDLPTDPARRTRALAMRRASAPLLCKRPSRRWHGPVLNLVFATLHKCRAV